MTINYMHGFVESLMETLNTMFGLTFCPVMDGGSVAIQEGKYLNPMHQCLVNVPFQGSISGDFFLAVDKSDWIMIISQLFGELDDMNMIYPSSLKELLNAASSESLERIHQDYPGMSMLCPRLIEGRLDYPATRMYSCRLTHNTFKPIEAILCLNLVPHIMGKKLMEEICRRRKETERADSAEQIMHALMEHSPSSVVLVDEQGVVLDGQLSSLSEELDTARIKGKLFVDLFSHTLDTRNIDFSWFSQGADEETRWVEHDRHKVLVQKVKTGTESLFAVFIQ